MFFEAIFLIPHSEKTIPGTIGSYRVQIRNNGDGTATFQVVNTSNWKSLLYGLGPEIPRGSNPIGLGGNMRQFYIWTEPIPPGACDCP